MGSEAERTIRLWRATEMFSPRSLPEPGGTENVVDIPAGEPAPWEPGGRLRGRPAAPGKTWRHWVFGGVFRLGKVRGSLTGESALFTCAVSAAGTLVSGPDVSECAWAVGQLALGDEAGASGDPSSWLTGSSPAGLLPVSRENLPDLPDGPLTGAALSRFTAELADLLGVADLLGPSGLRVLSYQADAHRPADEPPPLAGYFAAELARADTAVRESAAGLPLLTFLDPPEPADGRVDIRRQPLVVADGCAPDRFPPARWPTDPAPVLSEQFAVNEILARDAPVTAVDGQPTAVFNDLIAAIVTERARVLAALPSPAAAFGPPLTWGTHTVAPPSAAVAGFEILITAPGPVPGLAEIGAGWRRPVAEADYFGSTARLADPGSGSGSLAMVHAHLDDAGAFVDRFWHGQVPGSEALFTVGQPMRAALLAAVFDPPEDTWPGAVADFRSALAEVRLLTSERSAATAAVTRFSAMEREHAEAREAIEEAQTRLTLLGAREPDLREALVAAEERRRIALEDLREHRDDRPGLTLSVSTGLRADREWYSTHTGLRASFEAAVAGRDAALSALEELRADLAAARKTIAEAQAVADRLTASMDVLAAPVAAARERWGDHVPDGPAYSETADAALIERRENSAPWSDPEFAAARARLFLAALAVHRAVIYANAPVMEANLAVWADLVSGESSGLPPEVALAAWRSFFLAVPAVSMTFSSCGTLLADLGRGSVGWLLAAGTSEIPPRHLVGALRRANRAVLAGTLSSPAAPAAPAAGPADPEEDRALAVAARATRYGTWLPDGTWTGLPLHPRSSSPDRSSYDGSAQVAMLPRPPAPSRPVAPGRPAVRPRPLGPDQPSSDTETLQAILSDLRHRARSRRTG